jgi:hypothetical protein
MNPYIQSILALAKVYAPVLGQQAHRPTERAFTVPEKDVRRMMGNASEADKKTAVDLARKLADAAADFALFVASKGEVQPD